MLDAEGRVTEELESDVVLIATGADPRVLPGAEPDGERILDWRDVYDLEEMPEHLVVVGSGVTGAEFASGYLEAGVPVTLVSSRDRVLPGEDSDAAEVVEKVFQSRGGRIAERGRAAAVRRTEKGVVVELTDGRTVEGSHALMTVGTVPNTGGLNLERCGVEVDRGRAHRRRPRLPDVGARHLRRRRRHRRLPARLGRRHAGPHRDVARPRRGGHARSSSRPCRPTSSPTRRSPPSASRRSRWPTTPDIDVVRLPLATNARAKMSDLHDGFVKLFARRSTGVIVGGVVVAPGASELMLPIALAVTKGLTVADLAQTVRDLPVAVGLDHRGRPPADGRRRPRLTAGPLRRAGAERAAAADVTSVPLDSGIRCRQARAPPMQRGMPPLPGRRPAAGCCARRGGRRRRVLAAVLPGAVAPARGAGRDRRSSASWCRPGRRRSTPSGRARRGRAGR